MALIGLDNVCLRWTKPEDVLFASQDVARTAIDVFFGDVGDPIATLKAVKHGFINSQYGKELLEK